MRRVLPFIRGRYGLAFVAGLFIGAGQAPLQLWPLALCGMAIVFVLWDRAGTSRQAAAVGWWTGFGTFLCAMSWLVEPFLVEPSRTAWMIPFALIGMTGGLALFWSLSFHFSKRFSTGLMGLVVLWALAELARGYVFTGFPWALPAYIWLDTPVAQLAAYVGPYGLTALTFALAALCARAYVRRSAGSIALPVVVSVALFGLGAVRLAQPLPAATEHSLRVVQPNAPQHLKWDPTYIPLFFERALDLSDPTGADLVIWPETSVAAPLYAATPYLDQIAARVGAATAVVGLPRVDQERAYNSAVIIGAEGSVDAVYDKRHLVPFGEYIPFPKLLSALGLQVFTAQAGYGFTAGTSEALFDFGALGKALPLICYEAIFPRDTRSAERPDWLLQMTNDAWFGTLTGPQQSLAQARFRAIELGLPMVRAANTGISAITDARGEIIASIPLGEAGAVTANLPGTLPATLYARLGERAVMILLTIIALGAWLLPLFQRNRKTV